MIRPLRLRRRVQFTAFSTPGNSYNRETKYGINYGGGLKFKVKENWGFRLDARQYNMGKPFNLPNASGRLLMWEFSGGISVPGCRGKQRLAGQAGAFRLSQVAIWCGGPGVTAMKRTIQVRIFRGEHQYVADCLDLPVVTQAPTLDELAANIREAISLHLEGENLAQLGFSDDPTILATMELPAVA